MELGCECAWPARDPDLVHETTPGRRVVMPARTLLKGCAYVPSWKMDKPKRYTVDHLPNFGLQGRLRPALEIE